MVWYQSGFTHLRHESWSETEATSLSLKEEINKTEQQCETCDQWLSRRKINKEIKTLIEQQSDCSFPFLSPRGHSTSPSIPLHYTPPLLTPTSPRKPSVLSLPPSLPPCFTTIHCAWPCLCARWVKYQMGLGHSQRWAKTRSICNAYDLASKGFGN